MHPANKPDPTDPITIRPLTRDDFPLLHRWLNADHVQTWWHGQPATPTTIERKYGPRVDGVEPTRMPFGVGPPQPANETTSPSSSQSSSPVSGADSL